MREGIFANAGHAVSLAIVCDRSRNDNVARVVIATRTCNFRFISIEVVVDAVNLCVIGTGYHWQQSS